MVWPWIITDLYYLYYLYYETPHQRWDTCWPPSDPQGSMYYSSFPPASDCVCAGPDAIGIAHGNIGGALMGAALRQAWRSWATSGMLFYALGKFAEGQMTNLQLFVLARWTSARFSVWWRWRHQGSLRSSVFGSVLALPGFAWLACWLAGWPPFVGAASSSLAAGLQLVVSCCGAAAGCYSLPQSSTTDSVVGCRRCLLILW